MSHHCAFIMLGFLGSGKSYVSRWLAPHVGAVYLRADELRLAMFGADRPELYTPANKALVNNANRYAMTQILKSGLASVVYDANNNAVSLRADIARQAAEHGATTVVVWVQTPLDIAKRRAKERELSEGHNLFEPNLVDKMAKRLEQPGDNELVITIDGLASAAEQQQSFDRQWAAIQTRLRENSKIAD